MEAKVTREFFNCRRFDYDRRLPPDPRLMELEPPSVQDFRTAQARSGQTLGFPAWNLLYFALYCSLPIESYERTPERSKLRDDVTVVETGTNQGASTIVMARALEDAGVTGRVLTVDHNEIPQEIARRNLEAAGLTHRVEFHLADSHHFLRSLGPIDFAFLDDNHHFEHVMEEVEIIRPKLRGGASVYFDNTMRGGVAEVVEAIPERFGGNIVHFRNCSVGPPGNAIWQP